MTRKNFTIFAALLSIIALIAVALPYVIPQPSSEAFAQAIAETFPELEEDGQPVFTIDSIARHSGTWYIVSIKSKADVKQVVPVWVLLEKVDGKLSVRVRPGAYFTEEQLTDNSIPKAVKEELLSL